MPRDERTLLAGLNDPAVHPAIATGDLEILGLLPGSSNATFLVRAHDRDDRDRDRDDGATGPVLAVYKPRRGETPLWDFPPGTLCHREVAAYVVARALGWPRVPPTVLRDGPEGPGSVQAFVPTRPGEHYFTLAERFPDDFARIALFDIVVNNADRKAGHTLLGTDGRIWAIDHGLSFHPEPKLRTVIWDRMDEPIPAALLGDLRALQASLREDPERDGLVRLLGEEATAALAGRIGETLATPVFPAPRGERPFPWPPV